jgi:hypothetical protein
MCGVMTFSTITLIIATLRITIKTRLSAWLHKDRRMDGHKDRRMDGRTNRRTNIVSDG